MSDPCIRKSTSPAPVFAPRREENSSILERQLNCSKENDKVNPQNENNVTNVEENNINDVGNIDNGKESTEKGTEAIDVVTNVQNVNEDSSMQKVDDLIEQLVVIAQEDLKRKEDSDKQGEETSAAEESIQNEESTSHKEKRTTDVNTVNVDVNIDLNSVDIQMDLTISDDEGEHIFTKSNELKRTEVELGNEETPRKKKKTLKLKNVKSDEFVCSTSEDEKVETDIKRKEAIMLPHSRIDGKTKCKGTYHNGDKRGQACDKYVKNGDLCGYHKRTLSKDESPDMKESKTIKKRHQQYDELKRKMEQVETNCLREIAKNREDREKMTKLEKEIDIMKKTCEKVLKIEKNMTELKQTMRDFKTGQQEISNKIDYLLEKQKKSTDDIKSGAIGRRKIQKLDNGTKYKLLRVEQEDAVFETQNGTFKMVIPKELGKPDAQKKWFLIFNKDTKRYQWTED